MRRRHGSAGSSLALPCVSRSRARLDQWVIVKPLRHKKAEALEHRPVPQGFGVADEGMSIRLSIGEVVFETALDVPQATAGGRIGEQINHSPVLIGDGNSGVAAPQGARAEDGGLLDALEGKRHALDDKLSGT